MQLPLQLPWRLWLRLPLRLRFLFPVVFTETVRCSTCVPSYEIRARTFDTDRERMRPLVIPSWGLPGTGTRRTRLLALLAVKDGMRFLPGFLRNVSPQVDGIIALDDGSSDGSADVLAAHESVIEVLRKPHQTTWDEVGNHRLLVAAALRHGAEWILCIDADERLEREFRARAERVIRRGQLLGMSAYALWFRELWDDLGQYRADGIWGRKWAARLFRARADHEFDPAQLHGAKAPLQGLWRGRFPRTDLTVYHLGMLRPEDRIARRDRYLRADPERRWQTIGYEYLTDVQGIALRRVTPSRGFLD